VENDEAERNEMHNDGGEGSIDFAALGSQALQLIQQQATQHPLRTVGIAMGIGYVLGGGIPKVVVRLGMLAAGKAVSQAATIEGARALAGLLQGRSDGEGESAEEPGMNEEAEADATPPGQTRRNGHRRRRNQHARAADQA
jgi:hypothetical protein